MSSKGKGKAKIHISKPDLPPFLQRMREQIVANEDADRKEQSHRKRKERSADDPDEDPTVVKIGDDDMTEEEYKRMKKELETQYKLDSDKSGTKHDELDVDALIKTRGDVKDLETDLKQASATNKCQDSSSKVKKKGGLGTSAKAKQLSYGSSSEDED